MGHEKDKSTNSHNSGKYLAIIFAITQYNSDTYNARKLTPMNARNIWLLLFGP